jgi:hypothetical protein
MCNVHMAFRISLARSLLSLLHGVSSAKGRVRVRTIHDGEGRSWRVWHVVPQSEVLKASSLPGMHAGWLCFESEGDKRRLVNPPAGWDHLPEGELVRLLAQATRVKARAQPT